MTRKQVENALDWVLGPEINNALLAGRVNLPERLKMAAVKAFQEDWPNEGRLEYIRGALNMLSKEGHFTFERLPIIDEVLSDEQLDRLTGMPSTKYEDTGYKDTRP